MNITVQKINTGGLERIIVLIKYIRLYIYILNTLQERLYCVLLPIYLHTYRYAGVL